ncbi:MAG: S8 family serine peptidase [Dokdonella sp.]|uniref:S8 family serine peptidase n=1 Tax=Dokdonella sp. TaxID=2291710 RepID=UPI0032650FD6
MALLPVRTALSAALALALGATLPAAHSATRMTAAKPSIESIDAARSNPDVIILRAGVFDPLAQEIDNRTIDAATDRTLSGYAIVQFQPGRIAERKTLVDRGMQILGYVPNNAYYVRLSGVSLADVQRESAVRWAGPVRPALKLDPNLWQASRATSTAKQADGRFEIMVEGYAGVSSSEIQATLIKQVPGVEITMRSERADAIPYVRAKVTLASLDALIHSVTAIDGVAYVSPWAPTHTMNSGGIAALQGNFTGTCAGSGPVCGPAPMFDHGIDGAGQIIALGDSGTTPNAAWFATLDKGTGPHTEVTFSESPAPLLPAIGTLHPDNKILAYWLQPGGPTDYDYVSGHGTHTSGTLVGDAAGIFTPNTFMPSTPLLPNHDLADGMAPNAQLLMQDIGPDDPTSVIVQDLEGTLQQAYSGGARIHSDSWGSGTSGAYTSDDVNVDRATRENEGMLVVIAAGNDQAGAMATGSPGNSKNSVTVAALGHAGSLAKAGFSNAGPTADGRMKPDIAAPGSATISARNSAAPISTTITAPVTLSESGTSMATPTVAGNAVLQRQFFADGFYPRGEKTAGDEFNPTGAVMKAVLLNGTRLTTTPSAFPNTGTGWGRAWLDGNLWFKGTMTGGDDSRRLRVFERTNDSGLKTGDVNEYTIANVGAGIEFRATLTWFDPEASAGTASALVNNLDLEVVGPGNITYLGNHFASNVSTPGGTADIRDTVEQVRFTAPVAGSYTLRVKGTSVPGNGSSGSDRQGYAMVASGSFALPDPAPFAAPTGLSASSNTAAGIVVGFTGSAGAQAYQLYRAQGTCAAAGAGDFHLVAAGAASPLTDDTTQGGFSYAYKVRGVQNDVEGAPSSCFDVVSNDTCTLAPEFDTHSLIGDASNASCSASLAWAPTSAVCPAATTVTYKLERDTDPYFGTPQVIAPALTTSSYTDTTVTDGTPYYYRVTASDSLGNAAVPSSVLNLTPSGANGPDPAGFLDDVDTHSYMTMEPTWQITNTAASAGTHSYHTNADAQTYLGNLCTTLTMPPLTIDASATTLTFQAKYDIEYHWDGVVMEISTDSGSTWSDLPPVGGYPSSFAETGSPPANACAFPASHGAFNGVSTAASNANPGNGTVASVFKPFSANLSSFVGQTVQVRWRFASDPGAEFDGFYLDQVQLGTPGPADIVFADGFEGGTGSDFMCH